MRNIIKTIETLDNLCHLQPAAEEALLCAEKELGLEFSEEYKEYLLKYGVASAKGVELTGLCCSKRLNVVDVTLSERKLNSAIPSDMYVVENTYIDGIIILQNKTGNIFEVSPNNKPKEIFASLSDYILNKS